MLYPINQILILVIEDGTYSNRFRVIPYSYEPSYQHRSVLSAPISLISTDQSYQHRSVLSAPISLIITDQFYHHRSVLFSSPIGFILITDRFYHLHQSVLFSSPIGFIIITDQFYSHHTTCYVLSSCDTIIGPAAVIEKEHQIVVSFLAHVWDA